MGIAPLNPSLQDYHRAVRRRKGKDASFHAPFLVALIILSRPGGYVAAAGEPDIFVALGVLDDLLEGINRRHPRA